LKNQVTGTSTHQRQAANAAGFWVNREQQVPVT
jgi:hypothetical protein